MLALWQQAAPVCGGSLRLQIVGVAGAHMLGQSAQTHLAWPAQLCQHLGLGADFAAYHRLPQRRLGGGAENINIIDASVLFNSSLRAQWNVTESNNYQISD